LLADALAFAEHWHGEQTRKDGSPYVSHLLQVAGLVLEHGGDEEQSVAALLHDVVEDTGATFEEVGSRFGPTVEQLVRECTDTLPDDDRRGPETWHARKERYLEHLRTSPAPSVLISACDKLHNLRCMARDGSEGFNASAEDQAWFSREVVRVLTARGDVPAAIVDELRSLTDRAWR
jgi:(p)ppGpp synthase/HD superfamily hydrolase